MSFFRKFFVLQIVFICSASASLVGDASELSKQIEDIQSANMADQLLMEVIEDFSRNHEDACAYYPEARFRPLVIYDHREGGFNASNGLSGNRLRLDALTAGMEFDLVAMFGFGVAYGYTNSTISVDHDEGSIDGNSHTAMGFFRLGCLGPVNLDGQYAATWSWFDQDRKAEDSSRTKAKYMGVEQGAGFRAIFDTEYKTVHFLPIAGVRYVYSTIDNYNETGNADQVQWVKDDHSNQFYSDIGLNISRPISVGQTAKVTPQMGLLWTHQYLNDDRSVTTATNSSFTSPTLVQLPVSERNGGRFNLGFVASYGPRFSCYVDLDTIFTQNSRFTWNTRAGIKVGF